jgi:hypothetical protein
MNVGTATTSTVTEIYEYQHQRWQLRAKQKSKKHTILNPWSEYDLPCFLGVAYIPDLLPTVAVAFLIVSIARLELQRKVACYRTSNIIAEIVRSD